MATWLFKSEPSEYSFDALMAEPERTTGWDGVRNYQARNHLRDRVKRGDLVLFYHSNCEAPGIAGLAEVVEESHPDPTATDPLHPRFDPRSDPSRPTWVQVKIRGLSAVVPPVSLNEIRLLPGLEGMELLRRGSRLSIQPVTPEQWGILEGVVRERRPADRPRRKLS